MGVTKNVIGQNGILKKRVLKALASVAIAGTFVLGASTLLNTAAISGGETRTISLYHQHTRESVNVTYMVNGRYVPSAMRKINYVLRDWRRNKTITIDPKTIDLVWELHADLGSKQPVRIVCGYRSPATNAFLKRIGRNVAKSSQHTRGKAIDFFFSDVPLTKIRNSALARGVGGVGFYSGRNGFLHVDSGNVRHWGIRGGNIGSMIAEGRRYVGARIKNGAGADSIMVASNDTEKKSGGIIGWLFRPSAPKASPEAIAAAAISAGEADAEETDNYDNGEMAAISADASAASIAAEKLAAEKRFAAEKLAAEKAKKKVVEPVAPSQLVAALEEAPAVATPVTPAISSKASSQLAALTSSATTESLADQKPALKVAAPTPVMADAALVPKPRIKPPVVQQMAEAKVKEVVIAPVSAAPDEQTWVKKKKPSSVEPLGKDVDFATISEDGTTAAEGKSSLTADIEDLRSGETVTETPVLASAAEPAGWLTLLFSNASEAANPGGEKAMLVGTVSDVMPAPKALGEDGTTDVIAEQQPADGKEDLQSVNRDGKSSLEPIRLRLSARDETVTQVQ